MLLLCEWVLVDRGQRDGQIIRFGDHWTAILPAQAPSDHAWRAMKPEAAFGTTRIRAAYCRAASMGEI
jgi:hypothetical protein